MKKISDAIVKPAGPALTWETSNPALGALEVNVLFTDAQSTAAALKCAASFASDLRARICLRAGIVVPWQLPLDNPQISTNFLDQLLSRLAEHVEQDVLQPAVQIYLCRNWIETLVGVLNPQSLIVISEQRHWWPTQASRMVRALRSRGYRVVQVDWKARAVEDL